MSSKANSNQINGRARSAKQIEASQKNGAKGTGPKTEEGKRRSSMNALKYGIYAERLVPIGQDPQVYDEYRQRVWQQWDPQDALEEELTLQLIRYGWKIRFYEVLENSLYSSEILNYYQSNLPLDHRKTRKIDKTYLIDHAKDQLNKSDELLAIAFQQNINENRALLVLNQMDMRAFAKYHKTLEILQQYKRKKKWLSNNSSKKKEK